MPKLISARPATGIEPVTEILHGVPVTDPYRWLEEQNSPRTRHWIEEQTRYARSYLDQIARREHIRERVRELLDIETCDTFLKRGNRYFFRKRLAGEEQFSIYFRERPEGPDELLVNPSARGTGIYTAVRPLAASVDGCLLLYEVKQGGERSGSFEFLDVTARRVLPDSLPHGYLRGFAFATDGKGFYYAHEPAEGNRPTQVVYHHVLGTSFSKDSEVFSTREDPTCRIAIVSARRQLGILVYSFLERTYTDFYLCQMGGRGSLVPVIRNASYSFAPRFLGARIVAATDRDAPNRRIVEVQPRKRPEPFFFNLVPETDAFIRNWTVTASHIVVFYVRGASTEVRVFDPFGNEAGTLPTASSETVGLADTSYEGDEVLIERESFTRPVAIEICSITSKVITPLARRHLPFGAEPYSHIEVSYPAKDGVTIPMFLLGAKDALAAGTHPLLLTAYGGYGIPMTPRFSVLVASLIERGCLFALPSIRGGSEFGRQWHDAAKRRSRQVAIDDFLCAAEWLIKSGRTTSAQLGIFGGSNSGLLVAAALTQRPDLFRAVLSIAPMLDMLRYHLFDRAHVWKDEFGTADDIEDFRALAGYSPYQAVRDGTSYPATMLVAGDADQSCNALHARKMTARLQAATGSSQPIFLDYSEFRGHSPVLPLSVRVEALADRVAFFCDQLQILA